MADKIYAIAEGTSKLQYPVGTISQLARAVGKSEKTVRSALKARTYDVSKDLYMLIRLKAIREHGAYPVRTIRLSI